MANVFFPKGQVIMPYSRELLEKAVAASKGKMKPGCKFRCTMYSTENPGPLNLPVSFSCKFVELDDGIHIDYRVLPGALVWALLALPFVLLSVLAVVMPEAKVASPFGLLIAAVVFLFGYQRETAIDRFKRRFGK